MAAHDLQHQRAVFYSLGNRPGLIQRRGKRHHAIAAGAAIGGLDAHGASEGGRLADGTAGVRGRRREAKIASNGRRRAAG